MPPLSTSTSNDDITAGESVASFARVCHDAYHSLTVGPGQACLGGAVAIFAVGVAEARLWLKSNSSSHHSIPSSFACRMKFMVRYSLSQIIPSLIWGTQPASIIAQRVGLSPDAVWRDRTSLLQNERLKFLRFNHLVAIRGTIAGTVLLSQVISLVDIWGSASEDYSTRIREGREPPLDTSFDARQSYSSKVVRLAGEESDVTTLTMAREGRKGIFPIFESETQPGVQAMVRAHGAVTGGTSGEPRVPVYWCVKNGLYGYHESWRGFRVLPEWLFEAKRSKVQNSSNSRKLLILEADATSGGNDAMSLMHMESSDLDLDLYEVAQGFHKVESLVSEEAGAFDSLRILLVDPQVRVRKGGGYHTTAGEYVKKLDLADIVIDARTPLVYAMDKWLQRASASSVNPTWGVRFDWATVARKTPVILETPNEEWFQSIRSELSRLGYDVTCLASAEKKYGQKIGDIPVLVYEKSMSDTKHSVRRFVEQGLVTHDKICALYPHHDSSLCPQTYGLEEQTETGRPATAFVCSTILYDHLLSWVRKSALEGQTKEEIQRRLDEDLGSIISSIPSQ